MRLCALAPAAPANSYLVIVTEVRVLGADDVCRDESSRPERRRLTARAHTVRSAAMLARAFARSGLVRRGRHRVKVLAVIRRDAR